MKQKINMSLITYEFKRADNAGEIKQFYDTLPIMQKHFMGRKDLVLYLSGKLNINGVDIDGLIFKEDAIVLIEFKNYSGVIKAQVNGDWFHGNERINGGSRKTDGSSKTVFEQLKINRRSLREGLSRYTNNQNACNNIQALVVFTSIENLVMDPEFTWGANAWVNVTDINHIGEKLDTIKAKTRSGNPIVITSEDIFNFIRNKQFDERYIMTKYSDTNVMPSDLFHEDETHNGNDFSPVVQLEQEKAKNEIVKNALHDAVGLLKTLKEKMEKMTAEKDLIIQQQKAELLQIKADMLAEMNEKYKEDAGGEAKRLLNEVKTVEEEVEEIGLQGSVSSVTVISQTPTSRKRFGMTQKVLKDFNVETKSMDDDQLELIEKNIDKSMIVAGCAGCGKSVIAMYKAQQILESNGDVILIAYTKSLNRYMSQGKENTLDSKFFYHWQWVNQGMPKADYIIVDEIQDFEEKEIQQFIDSARKCFFFFGDTAQSIYTAFGKQTLTIDQISLMTGVPVYRLYNNYRLPKPIAKITQNYLGLSEDNSVSQFSDSIYLSKENALPVFVECSSKQKQVDAIMSIIKTGKYQNVGILVPENDQVIEIMNVFTTSKFACEFKYNARKNDTSNKDRVWDTLDFTTTRPKLMTYHSAKGLQFQTVILPFYQGVKSVDERKALYVAMTRSYMNLYVLYDGELKEPLSNVPSMLYEKRH